VTAELLWTQAEWLRNARGWIDDRLAELGLERTGPPDQVHTYPWATVLRVPTSGETLFFKAMVPQLAHEAAAVAVLARLRPTLVTELVVADPAVGWMLMKDAGAVIRDASDERLEDWERLLAAYAELQREAGPAVEELVAAGVPERRTESLAGLLADVLEDDAAVWADREQGLTAEERRRLRDEALPRLAELWRELAALPVPDTIQHDDLHAGQVFVRGGRWRILDWGDACITHPFASLLVPLRSLVYRGVVADGAPALDRLRDAYLEPWTSLAPRTDLLRAVDLASLAARGTRLLSWQRIVPHFDPPIREDYGESVPRWFRALLEDLG
jgi:hypothetical protein